MRVLLLSVIFSFLFTMGVTAQKTSISGTVIDSVSGQPLKLASIAVYTAKDTALVTYRLSGSSGEFTVTGLPVAQVCRLLITFQGYKIYRKEFELTKEKPQLDLGSIVLTEDAKALDEILVSTERPPMIMRNDTLEFNANAFKTLPTALLEDLLKKLPGVEVDMDGNMMVNGRRVNRLLVDGREFFGSDYRIATRNLPANVVDKVQVTDDAEEKRRNPRIQSFELGQIVNIKLKKAIRQGWFGKVYGGVGNNDRHEVGGIVNLFRDTVQLSLLGSSNNVNKPGFDMNDMTQVGGFGRGGEQHMEGYSLTGIQRSVSNGLNFNNDFGSKVKMNVNYFYKQNNSVDEGKSFIQQFLTDTVLLTPSNNRHERMNGNHRLSGSLEWRIDSLSTLQFRPSVSKEKTERISSSNSLTTDNFKGLVNQNNNRNFSEGKGDHYRHSISYSRSSRGKSGRSINITQSTSFNNGNDDNFQEGSYSFYNNNIRQDSLFYLLQANNSRTLQHSFDLNYSEAMTSWLQASLGHQSAYEEYGNKTDVYNKTPGTDKYNLYNELLSNGVNKRGWNHHSKAEFSFSYKNWELSSALNLAWFRFNNQFPRSSPVNQRLFFAYPSFGLRWRAFNLSYEQNVSPPDAAQLRPVIDITDPLYKAYGNPGLQPTVRHRLWLNLFHFFQGTGSSINFSVSTTQEENGVIELTQLDSNRVTISKPINIDGAKSFYVSSNYGRRIKIKKQFWLNLRQELSMNLDQRFISINGFLSKSTNRSISSNTGLSLSYNDLIELNQRYRLRLRQARYEDKKAYRDVDVVTHEVESALIVRWPKRVIWENGVNYIFNPQVSPGIRTSTVRWNSSVYYAVTKNEKLQLKISVFDLLNQNVNVYRYNGEGMINDYQAMTLKRYGMVSLVYHMRYFGSSKQRRSSSTFDF